MKKMIQKKFNNIEKEIVILNKKINNEDCCNNLRRALFHLECAYDCMED